MDKLFAAGFSAKYGCLVVVPNLYDALNQGKDMAWTISYERQTSFFPCASFQSYYMKQTGWLASVHSSLITCTFKDCSLATMLLTLQDKTVETYVRLSEKNGIDQSVPFHTLHLPYAPTTSRHLPPHIHEQSSYIITQNKRIDGRSVYVPAVSLLNLRIPRTNATQTFRLKNK